MSLQSFLSSYYQRRNMAASPVNIGARDETDIISYAGLEERSDYLVLDGKYLRVLFVSGYPYTASSGWLDGLINFRHSADISYHLYEIDANTALPKLHRKITELESTRRSMIRTGKIIGTEVTDPLESAIALRSKIQRGQEKLFQLSISICLHSTSLPELDTLTHLLEATLSAHLFYTRTAYYRQLDGLQSVLPRGEDLLSQKRNLDSSSAALTFPFVSAELVHDSGILFGVNKANSSLVILDRFSLQNASSITFAQSGSGKSYTTKIEILRQLMNGTRVIAIDPEGEYKQLADSVQGTYIDLSTHSREKINPFDLGTPGFSHTDLADHIQDLTEIISLMVEGIDAKEKANVDKALLSLYTKHPLRPVLRDFYNEIRDTDSALLCNRLEKFVSGSLAYVFSDQTNVALDNRLVVFGIKNLPESLRKIMMLIVSNYVSAQMKINPTKRLLVIDEAWILLEHEESARFIAGLVRRARKYYAGVAIVAQQAEDFLKNDYGRAIASQSAFRILLRQDTTTIKTVSSAFNLSEYEYNFLLTCGKGEALLIADQSHAAVQIIAAPEEHPLITTDPIELYRL